MYAHSEALPNKVAEADARRKTYRERTRRDFYRDEVLPRNISDWHVGLHYHAGEVSPHTEVTRTTHSCRVCARSGSMGRVSINRHSGKYGEDVDCDECNATGYTWVDPLVLAGKFRSASINKAYGHLHRFDYQSARRRVNAGFPGFAWLRMQKAAIDADLTVRSMVAAMRGAA